MRALVYVRGNDESRQELECCQHIIEKGYDYCGTVNGIGGLAEKIVNGEVDVIIIVDESRIARDRAEYEQIVYKFRGFGVTIEVAGE